MSELETRTEAELEDFTDELSDEALDREQGGGNRWNCWNALPCVCV